jgi:hypothetical protein
VRAWLITLAGAIWLLVAQPGVAHAEKGKDKPSSYQMVLPTEVELAVGSAQDIEIAIVPAEGYRVDQHGPVRIDLLPSDAGLLSIKKRSLRRRDAADKESAAPRFYVSIVGKSPGQGSLSLRYRFWLCRAKICLPIRGEASVPVEVLAPVAPDAGPIGAAPAAAIGL